VGGGVAAGTLNRRGDWCCPFRSVDESLLMRLLLGQRMRVLTAPAVMILSVFSGSQSSPSLYVKMVWRCLNTLMCTSASFIMSFINCILFNTNIIQG
jgi:hypothetical protein